MSRGCAAHNLDLRLVTFTKINKNFAANFVDLQHHANSKPQAYDWLTTGAMLEAHAKDGCFARKTNRRDTAHTTVVRCIVDPVRISNTKMSPSRLSKVLASAKCPALGRRIEWRERLHR